MNNYEKQPSAAAANDATPSANKTTTTAASAAPRPVPDEPALLFETEYGNAMAVADLHIGIEHELRKSGMVIFSRTENTVECLKKLIRENDISHLVINGDLKHNVPSSPWEHRKKEANRVLDDIGDKMRELTGKKENLESIPESARDENIEAELQKIERRLSYYRFKFVRERDEKLEYSPQEDREIPWVLRTLSELVDRIDIVKGNHDGALEQYMRDLEIDMDSEEKERKAKKEGKTGKEKKRQRVFLHPPQGITFGDVGIFHGHTWPSEEVMKSAFIVVAHNHPSVVLTDDVGARMREACWLRMDVLPAIKERYPDSRDDAEIIVMPAFDKFKKGIPVNTRKSKLMGPLLKTQFVDLSGARVYLLDGLEMGTVEALLPLAYGEF